jgi:multidrug efflux pump subunit AcrA (membrane-fusion protein)
VFGKAAITVGGPHEALLIPVVAVQKHNGSLWVFVKKSETVFEPRLVRVGARGGPMWEIESGIEPGEQVVTTGSYLFKTELERGTLPAGE